MPCEPASGGSFIFVALRSRNGAAKQAARKIADARRKGHGLKVQDFQLDGSPSDDVGRLVESILSWSRHTLAGCRRPYGIDHFDLTLALRSDADKRVKSVAFDRLRPIDLYQEWLPERLAAAIVREVGEARRAALDVSAALFSWGEAAHHALPNAALQAATAG